MTPTKPKACAIYARKSTEQGGDAESKSVARQVEGARAYAAAQGWTVLDDHVYSDDAVSGAETTRLRDRTRMLGVIRAGAPFQVLLMRDTSRFSRRDGDEAFGELKAITQAGVTVVFYQDGSTFQHGTLATNVVGFLKSEIAADWRRQVAAWTADAMVAKARRGHVTGGRVFGYDNVEILGPDGTRARVERRINEAEAAVVRRIFQLYAAGHGLAGIAHALNAEGAPTPRPQLGRPAGWSASSARAVLQRSLYLGEAIYGRCKKRDLTGQLRSSKRPPSEWVRCAVPDLRVVPADVAAACAERFASQRTRTLRLHDGQLIGRPPGEGSPYLLCGLLQCGVCGGSLEVLSSTSAGRRVFHYRCYTSRRKGATACANRLPAPMALADRAVLDAVAATLLDPAVVARALAHAESAILNDRSADQREQLQQELAEVERASARLTAAIAQGGDLPPLVAALTTHESKRADLETRLTALRAPTPTVRPADVRQQLLAYVSDWRGLLKGHVGQAQQILRRLVKGRLTFTPQADGSYTFEGTGTVRPLLAGAIRKGSVPDGIRTRVSALKGPRPGPLDDGDT